MKDYDYEIVIVDDNSPDGTAKVAEKLYSHYQHHERFYRICLPSYIVSLMTFLGSVSYLFYDWRAWKCKGLNIFTHNLAMNRFAAFIPDR